MKTGISAGRSASPWDSMAPSPVPIRASGSSVRSSSSRAGGRSKPPSFSAENSHRSEVLFLSDFFPS